MNEPLTQEQRGKSALKSGVWYTISSITVKAILIITTPIFTRLMSTSEYGTSATFTTWFTLLSVVCSLNVWYSIGRAKIDFPGKINEFVASIQLLAFIFTGIVEIFAILNLDMTCELLELPKAMVFALGLYLLAYPAVQLTQQKYKYTYNYKGNIAITVYTTISTVIFSLIGVFILPSQRALGKSLGAVISTTLFAIVIWISLIKKKQIKFNFVYWQYALKISVPLILNSISLNILDKSDRIFITKFNGSDYTGIYSLAYSYAVLINIILDSINQAWLPWFHDTFNAKHNELIRTNVKPLILFGCWIGIGCIAIAPEAISILGGPAFQSGIWVVPPITLGIVCNYIFQNYEHIELHLKKTWYISAGTIFAAIINIVLNYIFVPVFGFVAAAYTTLFCYLLLMIFHHFISRKILGIHLYNDRFMYLCILGTAFFCILFMVLYNFVWIIRWILIIVVSLIYLLMNRRYIIPVLKKLKRK